MVALSISTFRRISGQDAPYRVLAQLEHLAWDRLSVCFGLGGGREIVVTETNIAKEKTTRKSSYYLGWPNFVVVISFLNS